MKYTNIASTLGWDETPDTEEGLFLQPEEATAIDSALAKAGDAEQAAADLATANQTIQERDTTISTLQGQVSAAAEKETELNTRIQELEAENKKLGGQSSGTGTTLPTNEDPKGDPESGQKVTLNSPEHPLNQLAAKKVAAATARRK